MTEAIELLLVEDNPADVKLLKLGLEQAKIANHLQVVGDGVEAMAYLRGEPPHSNARRPDLILLDLNLPKKSGHQVLDEIKSDPALRSIPVVILTSSEDRVDVERTYQSHANCYISKPVGLEGFLTILQSIEQFWFTIVKLPQKVKY